MMFHSLSTLHRRRLCLLLGAALLTLSAVFQTSPAQGAYTLTLTISDGVNPDVTVGPNPSNGLGNASVLFVDLGAAFPEFTDLVIRGTAEERPNRSLLNKVDISGGLISGSANLTITLTGIGFIQPAGVVNATTGASTTLGQFGSFSATGTLDSINTGTATITASPPPAQAATVVKNGISVTAPYDAVLTQSIIGITPGSFNLNSSLEWSTPTPVPPTMILALTGVVGIGLSRLRRLRWKEFAGL